MRRNSLLLFGCVIVAVVAMGIGFALGGSWIGVAVASGLGGVWLLVHMLGNRSTGNLAVWLCFNALAAVGLAIDLPAGWMLIAAVAALCAWDMIHYEQRRASATRVDAIDLMDRRHTIWLALTGGVGLVLGAAALFIRVDFGFGIALVLALAAVILLSQLMRVVSKG